MFHTRPGRQPLRRASNKALKWVDVVPVSNNTTSRDLGGGHLLAALEMTPTIAVDESADTRSMTRSTKLTPRSHADHGAHLLRHRRRWNMNTDENSSETDLFHGGGRRRKSSTSFAASDKTTVNGTMKPRTETIYILRPIVRLYIIVKLAIICRRLSLSQMIFRKNLLYEKIAPYLESVQFAYESQLRVSGSTARNLLFDRSCFKADRRQLVPEEAKRVLLKPSWMRTEKELASLIRSLYETKSFTELPVRMQNRVAQVARYERYERLRIIVMQGDPARSFYFILSGSVLVLITEDDSSITRPALTMTCGMSFGELAIINRSRRQSTIVVKEDVELMSIDMTDYHKIFMLGGTKNVTDPDHVQFLKSVSVLDGWPVERMMESSTKCIYHYFKRGEVLIRNSQLSAWIIIVKSGSLKILKKLKRIDSADLRAYNEMLSKAEQLPIIDDLLLRSRDKRQRQNQRHRQQKHVTVEEHSSAPNESASPVTTHLISASGEIAMTSSSSMSPNQGHSMSPHQGHSMSPNQIHSMSPHHGHHHHPHDINQVAPVVRGRRQAVATRDELIQLSVARVLGDRTALVGATGEDSISVEEEDLSDIESSAVKAERLQAEYLDRVNEENCIVANEEDHMAIASVVDDNRWSSRYPDDVLDKCWSSRYPDGVLLASSDRRNYQCVDDKKISELSRKTAPAENRISLARLANSQKVSKKPTTRVVKTTALARKKMKSEENNVQMSKVQNDQSGIRTIAADLNSYRTRSPVHELTEADFHPEFIHVQTLVKGQVFGLTDVVLGMQPSLSVISNGAECILVDKQFYLEHAPETLLQRLRLQECCPYPSDNDLQHRLLLSVQWTKYRQNTLNDVISHKRRLKNLTDRTL